MPLIVSSLTITSTSVDATSYVTNSITPTANALILLSVKSRQASGVTVPTVTGNGLTWVEEDTANPASNRKITVFRALGASPSAGQVTVDFGGNTQTQFICSIIEITGADTSGTNGSGAIVQNPTATTGSSTKSTITLSAFASVNNMAVGFLGKGAGGAVTPGAGFTEVHDEAVSDGGALQVQYKINETDVSATFATSGWAAIAFEVKESVSSVPNRMMLMGVG